MNILLRQDHGAGGDLGRHWRAAAVQRKLPTRVQDLEACLHHLRRHLTEAAGRAAVVVQASSAGGVPAGALLNACPEVCLSGVAGLRCMEAGHKAGSTFCRAALEPSLCPVTGLLCRISTRIEGLACCKFHPESHTALQYQSLYSPCCPIIPGGLDPYACAAAASTPACTA